MTEPWLALITRIGVGIRREAYYRHRVGVAELALARSLRVQTDPSFTWVLVCDARAPQWVDGELERLAAGLSFEIWRRDPTTQGINPVDRPRVREMIAARSTILSRCDDDDLLHRTYVARVREELAGRTAPSALTFVRGGYLFHGKVYPRHYPWFTAGLAVLPDEQAQITPYLFNHARFGVDMAAKGFEARELSSAHPMWLRTISAGSDAGARSRRRPWHRLRPWWWERSTAVDLAEFGATDESVDLLERTLAEAPAPPTANPHPQRSRLAQKMELAQQIRGLKGASIRSPQDDAEIERLTDALYDL